jgi:hypothetical protein
MAIALILVGLALTRLARNDPRAGGTITAGFGLGLVSIVVATIIFGFLA